MPLTSGDLGHIPTTYPIGRLRCPWWLRAIVVGLFTATARVAAAETVPLRLEVNRLEPREGLCRVWMVANNAGSDTLDPVRLDLVLFGRDGVAARRLAVDIGPLPGGRTVVRLFDVASQPCDAIGQVLMNDVLACGGTDMPARTACADRIATASRIPSVSFEK